MRDTALLRRLIGVAGEIAEIAYDEPDDVTKALDEAENKVFQLADHQVTDSTRPLSELLGEAFDDLQAAYERGSALTGVATGYHDLDELLSGLQPDTLNIVGARPSMGKTAFALGAATHVAINDGLPVLFFSLEMGHKELTGRILWAEARVDSKKLRTGDFSETDWSKIGRAIGRLDAPLYLDDNPNVTVMEIRAKARRMKARHGGLGLIVVDYLQLMSGRMGAENRQVEVSELSRGLKILARELRVPILALSQLSRNLESRADKRPMLSDLRESGSIEQDADVVMFIYRDEVYNPDSSDRGAAEVIVAKHRNGPIGTRRLVFLGPYTRFDNAARSRLSRGRARPLRAHGAGRRGGGPAGRRLRRGRRSRSGGADGRLHAPPVPVLRAPDAGAAPRDPRGPAGVAGADRGRRGRRRPRVLGARRARAAVRREANTCARTSPSAPPPSWVRWRS